ncbi:MAG: hypothetical protein JO368_06205, partial [Acidimicrobiales bacterium]|nr:hypothetical protein [Acidimicrobiales bacterium]
MKRTAAGHRAGRSWFKIAAVFIAGAIFALAIGGLATVVFHDHFINAATQADPPENPSPAASKSIVVLGDSFASGEGARGFWADSGSCHRSWQTYAYM